MQQIKIDFDNPGMPKHLDVMEKDSQSRFFQAVLYKDGKAYNIPPGATCSIMYRGFGLQNQGWYDTINDGAGRRTACTVSGNSVTCEIDWHALLVPGHLSIVLCVLTNNGYMLKSWPIMTDVKNDNFVDTVEVTSYFFIAGSSTAWWLSEYQKFSELAAQMLNYSNSAAQSAASAQQQANAAAGSAASAQQQANAAAGSAASAQQQANAAAGSAASAKESKRQLENEIVSVTVLTPYGLTTAYGAELETSDGKQLEATLRVVRGAQEAQKAAEEASKSADKALLAKNDVKIFLRDYFFRLTELAADPLITADGSTLETAGGIPLEASVRAIRTAKTLAEAEYLPVSLGLLKQCLGTT